MLRIVGGGHVVENGRTFLGFVFLFVSRRVNDTFFILALRSETAWIKMTTDCLVLIDGMDFAGGQKH